MASRLSVSELSEWLVRLPEWRQRGETLTRTFEFADFQQAFMWMTGVALAAESLDHHPDWHNVYRRVEVELTTHDAGGLTVKDGQLAQRMDELAAVWAR